ncbi:MAG: hypothetical protein COU29_03835 [Candidatus Magasanikbacteria bacterium CG10_big_fil_rev_8_21_14_0_10_36_32]|uniref:Sulfatase N-terminal domain-containing protein n=1 Tax=Candidatus Magasanikbacteria bacterium CG10_big_fil_rev_8_21_14_0_10_36_32 TaxID=1974646 RepID=A0A2M6W5W5_9BACT|nr:MAG: hypothetical protein COU29_03835 [Candidatus Magasanikbacteria bacterium CG10_big_fil_rev_8_21_14_0_10_36_32]
MFELLKKIYKKVQPIVLPLMGSFFIAAGWDWYHVAYRPHWRWGLIFFLTLFGIFVGYWFFKKIYRYLTEKFGRHAFWRSNYFFVFLDQLFFIFSLVFLIFFSRYELLSFVYFFAVLGLLFWRMDKFLTSHPLAENWRKINRLIFSLAGFIFLLNGFFQYFAYFYYILDSNIKFYNIVLFRAWAVTMFWLFCFSLASLIYLRFNGRGRYAIPVFLTVIFLVAIFIGLVNSATLYHSSLYLNPIVWEHASGSGFFVFYKTAVVLALLFLLVAVLSILFFRRYFKAQRLFAKSYWYYYNLAIILVAAMSFVTVASLRNTPEAMIIKSFYRYFKGQTAQVELSSALSAKLERFGLKYNLNEFYISKKDKVYSQEKILLPEKFSNQKPNVIIVFLESFSSRLTDVYNSRLVGLTPGLGQMASDSQTTIFHNLYNPSTPTVTGLMAELCSFLPPTGHNEIEQEKHLQGHHLLCLPRILNENGYNYNLYITAVEKEFANKGKIIESMGIENFWGTKELAKKIDGQPLAWGYSDHQMFPVFFDQIQNLSPEEKPFLVMISTIDTHPPFDLVKDVMPYQDGANNLLNSIHTTDDAFGKFWDEFVKSEFYQNTIVIAVADHAVFPTAYTKDYFPQETGKMNFYDELAFMMYVPENILSKTVSTYSSGLDLTPTILQMLNINISNSFEGHSIFDDREQYPNLLGMHEFGLYINQLDENGKRIIDYTVPNDLDCNKNISINTSSPLTLCEFLDFYQWKRQMFEQGRSWYK